MFNILLYIFAVVGLITVLSLVVFLLLFFIAERGDSRLHDHFFMDEDYYEDDGK